MSDNKENQTNEETTNVTTNSISLIGKVTGTQTGPSDFFLKEKDSETFNYLKINVQKENVLKILELSCKEIVDEINLVRMMSFIEFNLLRLDNKIFNSEFQLSSMLSQYKMSDSTFISLGLNNEYSNNNNENNLTVIENILKGTDVIADTLKNKVIKKYSESVVMRFGVSHLDEYTKQVKGILDAALKTETTSITDVELHLKISIILMLTSFLERNSTVADVSDELEFNYINDIQPTKNFKLNILKWKYSFITNYLSLEKKIENFIVRNTASLKYILPTSIINDLDLKILELVKKSSKVHLPYVNISNNNYSLTSNYFNDISFKVKKIFDFILKKSGDITNVIYLINSEIRRHGSYYVSNKPVIEYDVRNMFVFNINEEGKPYFVATVGLYLNVDDKLKFSDTSFVFKRNYNENEDEVVSSVDYGGTYKPTFDTEIYNSQIFHHLSETLTSVYDSILLITDEK